MSKKIPAFTLNELMVVLLITVIAVGIALSVLRLVTGQLNRIQSDYQSQNELLHFQKQLKSDMDSAQELFYDEENEILSIIQNDNSIDYIFSQLLSTRQDNELLVTISNIELFYRGAQVDGGTIDALEFKLESQNKEVTVFEKLKTSARLYL